MKESLRRKIELRLEEKQKTSRARQQVAWLLMVAHAIIMFSLFRLAHTFIADVSHHLTAYLVIASLGGLVLSLFILLRQVKADEIELATNTAWLVITVALLSIVLTSIEIYYTFHHLEEPALQRPGFALSPQLFLLLTAIGLVFYLFTIQRRLKIFFIHSRNTFAVRYVLVFVTYLTAFWIVMLFW